MITKITYDTHNFQYFGDNSQAVYAPSIIVWRGIAHRCTFDVSARAAEWLQRYIDRNVGAIKVDSPDRATWFHNVNPMYTGGYIFESKLITLEVLPNWKLKISLTNEGREVLNDYVLDNRGLIESTYELLEYALCNGWTLDPDDDGRCFISLDASIDDMGNFDVHPGDLGWSYNYYAIRSFVEELQKCGSVLFDPYYFGENSLEDQRYI